MVSRSTLGGWTVEDGGGLTFTNLHRPPPASAAFTALLNPLRFPTLALPHGPDRVGGADGARERCRRAGPRHRPRRGPPGSVRHTAAGCALDLPLGGEADRGGRGGGTAQDRRVEVGGIVRRRAGAPPVSGAGAARVAGRARGRPGSLLGS